eukprot:PhM_4_TR5456/c0_g1_i2/m.34714
MAYLSDVTHGKLGSRRELQVDADVPGLRLMGEFPAYFRAQTLTSRSSLGVGKEEEMWCADQDGAITLRNGAFGKLRRQIDRKPRAFVLCMTASAQYVWVGLSDGCVRVYDKRSAQLVHEAKAHSGAVVALLATRHNAIFSAGRDWMIVRWDERMLRAVQRLTGHQNTVRCLSVDQHHEHLFSGGDDYSIRCWSVRGSHGGELGFPWPLFGHEDSVNALVTIGTVLVSASSDGTVRAWDTHAVGQLKIVETREAAVTCLMHEASTNMLWVGGVDGYISIFCATTFELRHKIIEHTGTFVTSLIPISRRARIHCWCIRGNGSVCMFYSDADDPGFDDGAFDTSLYTEVEDMRQRVFDNFYDINENQAVLTHERHIERRRKEQLVGVHSRMQYRMLVKEYFKRLCLYADQIALRRKRRRLAEALSYGNHKVIRRMYLRKWIRHARVSIAVRKGQEVSRMLALSTRSRQIHHYLHLLLEYRRMKAMGQVKVHVAGMLARTSDQAMRRLFFCDWRESICEKKRKRHVLHIGAILANQVEMGMLSMYWLRLQQRVQVGRMAMRRHQIACAMFRTSSSAFRTAFNIWLKFTLLRRHFKKQIATGAIIAERHNNNIRLVYYRKLKDHTLGRASARIMKELTDLEADLKQKQTVLDNAPKLSEEHLDRDIRQRVQAADDADAEVAALDAQIVALEAERERLRGVLQAEIEIDPDTPVIEQVEMCYTVLKSRTVSAHFDFDAIGDIRRAATDPVKRYGVCLKKLRTTIRTVWEKEIEATPALAMTGGHHVELHLDEGKSWGVPLAFTEALTRKKVAPIYACIRELVVLYDMLTYQQKGDLPMPAEIVLNVNTMMQFVKVEHKRRIEDMGGQCAPKELRRSRTPNAASAAGRTPVARTPARTPQDDALAAPTADTAGARRSSASQLLSVPGAHTTTTTATTTTKAPPGWLGMNALETPEGVVMVKSTAAGSPAQKGGLQTGDVLLHFGGVEVTTLAALQPVVKEKCVVGAQLEARVRRGGKELVLHITVAPRPTK